MKRITAREIERKVKEESDGFYAMSLVGEDKKAVEKALSTGIDACLEAAFVPGRGDKYEGDGRRLSCTVSASSLAVLLRRLTEIEDDEGAAESLASSVLETLGWGDLGLSGFTVVSAVDQDSPEGGEG